MKDIYILGVIIFGILVYKGDLFNQLEKPFYESLKLYEDDPTGTDSSQKMALKNLWNTVQTDARLSFERLFYLKNLLNFQLKCCGVKSADDWRTNVTNPGWSQGFNKPLGCCNWKMVTISLLLNFAIASKHFI